MYSTATTKGPLKIRLPVPQVPAHIPKSKYSPVHDCTAGIVIHRPAVRGGGGCANQAGLASLAFAALQLHNHGIHDCSHCLSTGIMHSITCTCSTCTVSLVHVVHVL